MDVCESVTFECSTQVRAWSDGWEVGEGKIDIDKASVDEALAVGHSVVLPVVCDGSVKVANGETLRVPRHAHVLNSFMKLFMISFA